jgi:hypothetical protein
MLGIGIFGLWSSLFLYPICFLHFCYFVCNNVGSSFNYVVFRPLVGDFIPLTMDIKTNNFVEVFDHAFVVRFKLHAHSLLVERKLHDTKRMVVDAIF